MYAVNEIDDFDGGRTGAVSAFKINRATGGLTLLSQETSGGGGPCHLSINGSGTTMLVANYGGGSIESLPILADGRLGKPVTFVQHKGSSVNPRRQKEPHAHHIVSDPSNRFVLACDLGLDKVLVYKLDSTASSLSPADVPFVRVSPGAGPRHLAFHPGGNSCYTINELNCTVTAFRYNSESGQLGELQTISTLPFGESVKPGYSTAEIAIHPNGKLLFGSNRGHDTIAVFSISQIDGKLRYIQNVSTGGKTPRNFAIDPTGEFLLAANQNTGSIVVFRIDAETGAIIPTGNELAVPSPVSVVFARSAE